MQRCVLSDVLPYEIPLPFSNRYFYRFLVENGLEMTVDFKKIQWESKSSGKDITYIVKMLFGLPIDHPVITSTVTKHGMPITKSTMDVDFSKFMLRPFFYKIRHRDNDYRELAVCHPIGQLYLSAFYKKYKELILYYCNKSNFSIRRPYTIATYAYFNDRLHIDSIGDEISYIEEYDKEYENIRSFFVYKDYSNVYKFYESFIYHHCEKKFNKLLKLDITKCFDSIYTHSIAWAIFGKDTAKKDIKATNKTFAGEFDKFMQTINYRETNGIIIGPEFSRIFAELILQAIDNGLEYKLRKEGRYNRAEYQIFRYVDDFFVFYNNDDTLDKIIPALQAILRDFKLYLNVNKQILFEKPIVTEISIAKHKISELLENGLIYNICEECESNGDIVCKGKINIQSKSLIVGFKIITSESNVNINDILAYTFSIIERKIKYIFKNYTKVSDKSKSQKELVRSLGELLDFIFFLYSFSTKVNLTIKLSIILNLIIKFCKSNTVNIDFKHIIFNIIFENVSFFLKKNKSSEFSQVENLYLITILSELGKNYKIEEELLERYFNLIYVEETNTYRYEYDLNYFSLMSILSYAKKNKKYRKIKKFAVISIINKLKSQHKARDDAESLILVMDSLACPYIENVDKESILTALGITDPTVAALLISQNYLSFDKKRPVFFFKWEGFDFSRELDAKQSYEVY
jgi:hypothetical protein